LTGEEVGNMGKDKIKKIDIKFFIIPFAILSIGFAMLSYFTAVNRIEEHYHFLEKMTLNIADGYSQVLTNSGEAYDIITELLDEKILVASQAIMLIKDKENNETLRNIARQFNIDEIYLYNDQGEVVYSTVEEYVGWTAFEGHPVYDFMVSDQNTLVEAIRPDSESGVNYKFGYVKNGDGTFVQIGVLAENVNDFRDNFEITKLVNRITNRGDAEFVFFIDLDYEIVASNLTSYIGHVIKREDMREHILDGNSEIIRDTIEGQEVYQVAVPIYMANTRVGTLAIAWPADEMNAVITEIIVNGVVIYLVVVITIGLILYYAFRKNRANVKLAYYDKLTGLPNNEYLAEYLKDVISNLGNKQKAVMLLNCTNFKTLNMTYGFAYGDQILTQIAHKAKKYWILMTCFLDLTRTDSFLSWMNT
jgi:hypothetical protein